MVTAPRPVPEGPRGPPAPADEPRARLVERESGAAVEPVEVCGADGRVLGPDDTRVLLR